MLICILNLNLDIRPPRLSQNPDFDKLTLNSLWESYFMRYSWREQSNIFKLRLQGAQQGANLLHLCVHGLNKSVKQLRLSSVRRIGGYKHPLSFKRCPASTPELISIFLCQNACCNVVVFTSNPNFEISPPNRTCPLILVPQ